MLIVVFSTLECLLGFLELLQTIILFLVVSDEVSPLIETLDDWSLWIPSQMHLLN